MKLRTRLIAMIFSALMAGAVQAGPITDVPLDTPIFGGRLIATGGEVVLKFLGSEAAYLNRLYLDKDLSNRSTTEIFNNKETAIGFTVSLGVFAAGTELIFRIDVFKDAPHNTLDSQFFSGEGSRNDDGLAHVEAITTAEIGSGGDLEYFTTVGFEDIYGGGDNDFDDLKFMLSNVVDPPFNEEETVDSSEEAAEIAEPSVLYLLAGGMVCIIFRRRRCGAVKATMA